MKKILIGFVGVLGLAVAAALVAPSFIDWNAYRGEIAAEVRKATGRALTIDGSIDVAILPSPKLTLTKARLANIEGAADPDMVRLAALDLRIALWPLLSGKVVVQSVVLRGADIRLEKLADGRENWNFDTPRPVALETRGRPGTGSVGRAGDAISLQQVVIESGALSFRDSANGEVRRIEAINARIAAATLSGPFVARGEFRTGGEGLGFELRTGRIGAATSTKISLEVLFPKAKAKLTYSGVITPGKPSFTVTGKIATEGPDLAAFIAALGRVGTGKGAVKGDVKGKKKSAPKAAAQPFTLKAGITGGSDTMSINDITARVNGTRVSGAVNIAPGAVTNIDGTFKITRLDLDRWLAGPRPAPGGVPDANGAAKRDLGGFSLPKNLSVSVDAEIDGIVFRKKLVRGLRARVLMEKGVLNIRNLSARLPGGTEARVSGRLRTKKGIPRFDGRLSLDSSDFRAILRWLDFDDGALPRDRLHKVHFQAGLGAEPRRIELRDIDLRFDSSRVTGGMVMALRQRLGIGARLNVDRLNLDAYLATEASAASDKPQPGAKPAAQPPGAPPSGQGGFAAFGAFDANFNITAGRLTYGGERIKGLVLEGALIGGDLTVDKLAIASFAGARVQAKGVVRKLDKSPLPDMTLRLLAKDPARLIRLLPISLPIAASKLAPLKIEGKLGARGPDILTDLKISAGKIKISAKGTLAGLNTGPRLDLDFKLGHPDFVTFVRLFDPRFRPEKRAHGPFEVSARVTGSGLDLKLDKLKAQLGEARLRGSATLSLAAIRPLLKADLKGDEIIVGHFLADSGYTGPGPAKKKARTRTRTKRTPSGGPPWSDAPIDLEMLKLIDADLRIQARAITWRRWRVTDPRLDLTLNNGRLDMRRLTGSMVGGSFHMTGGVGAPARAGGPLSTWLDLDVARMDLKRAMFNAADIDIAKGKVDFKMSLTGGGVSSRTIARSLAGSGSLSATQGEVSGFDLARVNQRISGLSDAVSLITLLQTAMAGGSTRFSRLGGTFTVKGGVLKSNDVSIIADGGTGNGKLMVDMGRWLMDGDLQFRLSGNAKAPPFGLRMRGPLDEPKRIIKANALQAWLANRAAGALLNQFIGRPAQDSGTQSGTSQPQPSTKEQFIRGIFDLLRK